MAMAVTKYPRFLIHSLEKLLPAKYKESRILSSNYIHISTPFPGPETSPAAKVTIKNMLPHGLKESISKVRNIVCKLTYRAVEFWGARRG